MKGSILTGQQKTNFRSAPSHSAQAKLKPVVTVRYTVNTTSHLKKQSTTGIQSLGKAPSNANCTTVTKSNSRSSSSSKATWSCPMKSVFARLSLGPLVKTKTGLVPAAILPRNGLSQNLTHTAIPTDPISSASYKLQSKSSTSVTVPKRSAIAQKKTLPTTVLKNPVSEKKSVSLTAGVKIKQVQDQNKSDPKLLLGGHSRPSCTNQLSSGLKSTSHFSKSTKGHVKTGGTVEISKHNKSIRQLTDRFPKQRSECEGEKNGQQYRVPSQTSSGPASRCSSKAADRVMQKGHSLINAQPPQTRIKRTNAPVMSQTVPQPARTISRTSQARDTKTTKVPTSVIPQTEGKKQTAAQEERM